MGAGLRDANKWRMFVFVNPKQETNKLKVSTLFALFKDTVFAKCQINIKISFHKSYQQSNVLLEP